jgi:hypothetical protein
MAYQRQNFKDGQVLTAESLNKMEIGIEDACSSVKTVNGMVPDANGNAEIVGGAPTPVTVVTISLPSVSWAGSGNIYHQVVSIPGITENSQVNLTPSVEQLAIFYEKDITFVTENDGGVVTVYVIGQMPQNDYTIQANIVEVLV